MDSPEKNKHFNQSLKIIIRSCSYFKVISSTFIVHYASHQGFLNLASVTRGSLSICSANQLSSSFSSTGHATVVPVDFFGVKSKKKKKKAVNRHDLCMLC